MTDPDMLAALFAAVPFGAGEPFRVVELTTRDGTIAAQVADRFPASSIVALAADAASRAAAGARLAQYGDRVKVRSFALDALDWWDVMFGADLVVAVDTLHALNDTKTQYLYKAAADRLSARGVLMIADSLSDRPSALLHQLIWLRHAGFGAVECVWLAERKAVFGGFKSAAR